MTLPNPARSASGALLVLLACTLLGMGGCTGPATTPANIFGVVNQPSASVSFCNSGDPACTPVNSASLQVLRDLRIVVNWQNLPAGSHLQTLLILMPGGGLYQTFQDNFQVAADSQGAAAITRTVPVAGTWITQRSLTGQWQAQVFLDGQQITTQAIALTP